MATRDPASHEQNACGREADDPIQIPAAGWKDILNRVWRSIADDRIMVIAGAIAFYGIWHSTAVASFVALYEYFLDPVSLSSPLGAFSHVLPEGALKVIGDEIQRARTGGGTVGAEINAEMEQQ